MKPPHCLIYTHGGGRLGNQIVRFLHWMAWAREHEGEVEVIDLAFWPFAQFFATWREHAACVFPLRRGLLDGLARRAAAMRRVQASMAGRQRWQHALHAAGSWVPGWQAVTLDIPADERLDLDETEFLARVRRRRVTTCCGWQIASWRLVEKWQTELRGFFCPAEEFEHPATEFLCRIRARHDFVIGVQIRQSDYQTWCDGRFYFSTARYAEWMRELLALHGGKRIAFVVASDERQDPAAFAGLPVFQASGNPGEGGHWFEKWVELALCDVVVTPPSTFSATAAFYGNVPLWPVVATEQRMALAQRIDGGFIGAARHPQFSQSLK